MKSKEELILEIENKITELEKFSLSHTGYPTIKVAISNLYIALSNLYLS